MTVAQIVTRVRQIVQQTNPNNSVVSDATILGWVNEATLALCSMLTTLPKESVASVVAADTVTLGKTLLRLDYAAISDGTDYHPLKTIDFNNFIRQFPDWINADDGKPVYFVRMTDKNWMMHPNPDADWVGKNLAIYGSVLPADLTLTTEEPPLSVTLHHAYPHYCAWLFFLALNAPEKAAAEYATFDGIRRLNMRTATSTQGSMLSLRMGNI